MSPPAPGNWLESLRPLLEPGQLDQLRQVPGALQLDRSTLLGELVKRKWLTRFQAEEILAGRTNGLIIGHYLILRLLGEGGMGKVFQARHLQMGRVVALKQVNTDLMTDPDSIQRFRREMLVLGNLKHPNIVHALDADEIGSQMFLVMEYVEGVDLHNYVERSGPLSISRALRYIVQTAKGLQHAHEQGLVHRDIKPSNLLLSTKDQSVRILDLGLARFSHRTTRKNADLTAPELVMGTPAYIAPEQARDSRSADIRSDIYSLGCTLYFLLTARPPFTTTTVTDLLYKHWFEEPDSLTKLRPEIPPSVAALVNRMMAKKREQRFQTPAELLEAIQQLMTPDGQIRSTPANRFRFNGERVFAIAAGLIVLGVVIVLFIAWPSQPSTGSAIPSTTVPTAPEIVEPPPIPVPVPEEKQNPPSSGTVSPTEAAKMIGSACTLEMRVANVGGSTKLGRVFLNSESDYLNAKNFTVVLMEQNPDIAQFRKKYQYKTIRVQGTVRLYNKKPQIEAESSTVVGDEKSD